MRRFVITSGILVTAALAALLLLPWWLGALLPVVGRATKLEFTGYARVGYAHFRLETLEIRRSGVTVRVHAISAETPLLWLWHRVVRRPSIVAAGEWSVDVQPQSNAPRANTASGWMPLKGKLGLIADRLDFWLPRATTGTGAVRWPGHEIDFGPAGWERRTLKVTEVRYQQLRGAPVVTISGSHEFEVKVTTADGNGVAELTTQGSTVAGGVTWWGQRAELAAVFENEKWTPREATLRAATWEFPGDRLGLAATFANVHGEGLVAWKDGRLGVDFSAKGEPQPKSAAPPLSVDLHGHADANGVIADALSVELPGVAARLTEPLAVTWRGRLRSAATHFAFKGDLARLPWLTLRGIAQGEATISPGQDQMAVVAFTVAGEKIGVGEIEATRVDANGRLAWPKLEIAAVRLGWPDGREVEASGDCNFREHTLDAVMAHGTLPRTVLARWLPGPVHFDAVEFDARGSGPWSALQHEGHAQLKAFAVDGLKPIDTEASWHGRGAVIDDFEVNARAGASTLAAAGKADAERATVATFTLRREDGAKLELTQPATIRWRGGFQLDDLHLAGAGASLDATLHWTDSGTLGLKARQFDSRWLRDLVRLPRTQWTAASLDLRGDWSGGVATFQLESLVSVELGVGRSAQINAQATGDGSGIKLVVLRVGEGEGVIVNAAGQLPVVLHPRRQPLFEVRETAPFALTATTSPNPAFWKQITELAGIEAVNPEVTARLEGSVAKPRGEMQFRADRLAAAKGAFTWDFPRLEALEAHVIGDENGLELDRFALNVEGQPVRARGRLPLGARGWQTLWTNPIAAARTGDLRVEIPDAEIAAIARYFPGYLAPKGRLQVDLTFKANDAITGFVRVQNATSRPLGPLGVLQEINADLQFEGRSVELKTVTAKMGGQAVTLQGRAALPPEGSPQLELALTGENLPFVRQTGLLLRGDLDLKLTSEASGRGNISGKVRLRDSLFLSDIRSLIPTGQKGTATRPPYFSIEAAPINRWRLEVAIEGEKFLRLRTPVFNGTASAKFQLAGTLQEPRATGEATIDEGNIRLPFASFAVQQGQVRLTQEQPEPQLFLTGTTRRYGYDLRLELSGAAASPILTFSSSPPLESEQVLLMVVAGQAPRDEIATTDRQRAARVGAFVGQSLLGALGGGADGADRLSISSGENVSAQGRETYSIEYRLNDRWALTGEYDEFDDYYGGVKWRFYEKGGKHANAKK